MQEVRNAVDQTSREIATRFDFKGTDSTVELKEHAIELHTENEQRLKALTQVLEEKLVRRKVSLKSLDPQKVEPAGGKSYRQLIKLREGIETEKAKEIVKMLKGSKLKVQAAIQGDLVRVTGKKRDELQEAIGTLRGQDLGLPLQFTNFRE